MRDAHSKKSRMKGLEHFLILVLPRMKTRVTHLL